MTRIGGDPTVDLLSRVGWPVLLLGLAALFLRFAWVLWKTASWRGVTIPVERVLPVQGRWLWYGGAVLLFLVGCYLLLYGATELEAGLRFLSGNGLHLRNPNGHPSISA